MPFAAVVGGISAAGALGGAAIQSHEAGKAASTQQQTAAAIRQQALDAAKTASDTVNAATTAANTTLGAGSDQANQVIGQTLQQQLATLKPYVDSGTLSLAELQSILAPGGSLTAPQNQFKFTPADYQNSQEFNFIQQQANQALQRSAAAQGTGLGGGFAKASDQLNTNLANTYLNDAFNRALSTYNTNRQNLLTQIQGLTNVTGLGYNATGAANQDIGNAGLTQASNIRGTTGQQAANTIGAGVYSGNTGLTAAQIAAQAESASANAQSAADIAQGNAFSNALSSVGNTAALTYGLTQAPKNFGGGVQPSQNPISGSPGGYDPSTNLSVAAPVGPAPTVNAPTGTTYLAQSPYI